jgi:hypothetical protein
MPRGTGLKTVFVAVCGNLQHMTKQKIFKVVLLPYTSATRQNAAKISYINFWMKSVLRKTSLAYKYLNGNSRWILAGQYSSIVPR